MTNSEIHKRLFDKFRGRSLVHVNRPKRVVCKRARSRKLPDSFVGIRRRRRDVMGEQVWGSVHEEGF